MSAVFASLTALPRWSALVSFASVAAVIIAVPGPSVLFVIGRAVSVGRRAAVVTVWGNAVGVYLQVLAVAAGIGALAAFKESCEANGYGTGILVGSSSWIDRDRFVTLGVQWSGVGREARRPPADPGAPRV